MFDRAKESEIAELRAYAERLENISEKIDQGIRIRQKTLSKKCELFGELDKLSPEQKVDQILNSNNGFWKSYAVLTSREKDINELFLRGVEEAKKTVNQKRSEYLGLTARWKYRNILTKEQRNLIISLSNQLSDLTNILAFRKGLLDSEMVLATTNHSKIGGEHLLKKLEELKKEMTGIINAEITFIFNYKEKAERISQTSDLLRDEAILKINELLSQKATNNHLIKDVQIRNALITLRDYFGKGIYYSSQILFLLNFLISSFRGYGVGLFETIFLMLTCYFAKKMICREQPKELLAQLQMLKVKIHDSFGGMSADLRTLTETRFS